MKTNFFRVMVSVKSIAGKPHTFFIPLLLKKSYTITEAKRDGRPTVFIHNSDSEFLGFGRLIDSDSFYGLEFTVNPETSKGKAFITDMELDNQTWFDLHTIGSNELARVIHVPFSTHEKIDWTVTDSDEEEAARLQQRKDFLTQFYNG